MKKILIMGLPGSGKTTFAESLIDKLDEKEFSAAWYNADVVRELYDDWDFTLDGRLRQAQRMAEMASLCKKNNIIAVCDFVCPTEYLREVFDADIVVWMNTIDQSKYEDTNSLFEPPGNHTYGIANFEYNDYVIDKIIEDLK